MCGKKEYVIFSGPLLDSLTYDIHLGLMNEDGIRFLQEHKVSNINQARVEIFSREHPPPHFRVKIAGKSANFTIKSCEKISGCLGRFEHNVKHWHKWNKNKLIQIWDETRPSDCPVGKYVE